MATNSTLLSIRRDTLLEENGYELVTATSGSDGLRLLMSHPVNGIVPEYHLGLLDSSVVAAEIEKVKPQLPVVMLADPLELPQEALTSVDTLVTKSDGAHVLWANTHFVLNVKPARHLETKLKSGVLVHFRWPASSRERMDRCQSNAPQPTTEDRHTPFSSKVWRDIGHGRSDSDRLLKAGLHGSSWLMSDQQAFFPNTHWGRRSLKEQN
jgi:CheY-like chemotaxis protein